MCEQTTTAADADPQETQEWLDALDDVVARMGPERAGYLLERITQRASAHGARSNATPITPPVNTIAPEDEPPYPGDLATERRIEAVLRWNAVAVVMRANHAHPGLGGHLATYASMATIYEVAFNHFFRGRTPASSGDQVFFQGHGSPGIYARLVLEGRLTEARLEKFRQEVGGEGLPSYPHPWLLPDVWQFPTVSMGLGALTAIYQARFNRYLANRELRDTSSSRVWCFCGDGEMDEPESLGALTVASRERLDNLTFVINCNLQRLDGPVRGNGSIVAELEGVFRGAGWHVIKCLWASAWDPLFAKDEDGQLVRKLAATLDGDLQRLAAAPPDALRKHLFTGSPELEALGEGVTDEQLAALHRGGHDPLKVHAALKAATEHRGAPTVVLMHTVKGWGLGSAEGKNTAHQHKSLKEDDLGGLAKRFALEVTPEQVAKSEYLRPTAQDVAYLRERRAALGGPIPARVVDCPALEPPSLADLGPYTRDSEGREASTTMAFVRLLTALIKDKNLGKYVVPIVPDEARTFGMESLFSQVGIYSWQGQLYEPIDRKSVTWYREAKNGQVLEEGITEGGSLASFAAAGTAYATHGVPTIPFYIFYSMFGFQRVMDLIWGAADARARGFLLGATAGRTTLNGEGLQHEDGHGHLLASAVPHLRAYDPAYSYEVAVIVQDGLRRMYRDGEPGLYYLTLYNENHTHPGLPSETGPAGVVVDGILRGMYRLQAATAAPRSPKLRAQLLGSGPILNEVIRAQGLLAERFGVAADVWSVTSYNELKRDAQACSRWNRLHPESAARVSHVERVLAGCEGPVVASSDNVQLVAQQIAPWVPNRYVVLGTDGFGRSDTRAALRRHFEIDAEHVVVATLRALCDDGHLEARVVAQAIRELGLQPDGVDPAIA